MEKTKQYIPRPLETSGVVFPEELNDLAESIAKNVHDVWAQNRIAEGWTYGPVRNDSLKQTPCLVPYEDLPEEEKAYDRRTAFETLRFIVALGFRLTREPESSQQAV